MRDENRLLSVKSLLRSLDALLVAVPSPKSRRICRRRLIGPRKPDIQEKTHMAKIAKTADRKKVMDTTKSTDCPKCGKPTRIVKRVKDRERNTPGGIFISCSGCEFFEKL